jgi:hypothetical protein
MKTSFLWVIAPLLLSISLVSCDLASKPGSGNIIIESRDAIDFDKVDIGGAYKVFISQGSTESVRVEADDNLLPLIKTEVRGNTLYIKSEQNLRASKTINIFLTIVKLSSLSASGSVDIESQNDLHLAKLSIDGSGSTNGTLTLFASELKADFSGASEFTFKGRCNSTSFDGSGSSEINAIDLVSEKAKVDLSGAGSASINASEFLDVSISGAGEVVYKGSPKITQDLSGAGSVKPFEKSTQN